MKASDGTTRGIIWALSLTFLNPTEFKAFRFKVFLQVYESFSARNSQTQSGYCPLQSPRQETEIKLVEYTRPAYIFNSAGLPISSDCIYAIKESGPGSGISVCKILERLLLRLNLLRDEECRVPIVSGADRVGT